VVEFVFPSVVRACVRRPKSKCRLKTIPTTIVHCASKPRQKLSFFPKNLFYIQRHVLLSLSFTSSSFLPCHSLFLAREPRPLAEMRVRPKNKMEKKRIKDILCGWVGSWKKKEEKQQKGKMRRIFGPAKKRIFLEKIAQTNYLMWQGGWNGMCVQYLWHETKLIPYCLQDTERGFGRLNVKTK